MSQQPLVKCAVSSCSHWLSGNMCGADTIDIWHEEKGRMAQSTEETQCKSFYKSEGALGVLGSLHNADITGTIASILPGQATSPGVHCIVSTCIHWDTNDICRAEAIEVSGGSADEGEDTNCRTFAKSAAGQRAPTQPRLK